MLWPYNPENSDRYTSCLLAPHAPKIDHLKTAGITAIEVPTRLAKLQLSKSPFRYRLCLRQIGCHQKRRSAKPSAWKNAIYNKKRLRASLSVGLTWTLKFRSVLIFLSFLLEANKILVKSMLWSIFPVTIAFKATFSPWRPS
jgi:hypothetical protein